MNDYEVENLVLGAVLIDRDCMPVVSDILTDDIFRSEKNKIIWKALTRLYNEGLPIDIVTVTNFISKNGESAIVTPYDVTVLTSGIIQSSNVETHALILKENWIRRVSCELFLNAAKDTGDQTKDIFDVVNNLQSDLNNLNNPADLRHERKIDDIVFDIVNAKEIDSGLQMHPLLNSPKSLRGGDLVILAARPSMGKTAFAISVAAHSAESGYNVGILSLEMTSRSLVSRMIAGRTGINYDRILSNQILAGEEREFLQKSNEIARLPIFIDDQPGLSETQLKSKAVRMKIRHDIDILIVDYLQLIHASGNNREQEISKVSASLKTLAKKLDIPIIALSQLSRAVESRSDKKPLLSDLRDSGSIEQDADIVMFMYRPEYYGLTETPEHRDTTGLCQMIVSKQRNGALITTDLKFIGERFLFDRWGGGNVKKVEF